jgi:hypothetical protein
MLPMDFCNYLPDGEREQRARRLLGLVGLEAQADKLPANLSGGEQQRVAIARALANDPPLLLADEPTGNLDSTTAVAVFRLFEDLVEKGKTVLMVTRQRPGQTRQPRRDCRRRRDRQRICGTGAATLSVDQLGWVTSNSAARLRARRRDCHTGEPADRFYITKGQVDILLHNPGGQDITVTTMHAGQYFGRSGLLRGSARIATVRAADTPVRSRPRPPDSTTC